MATKKLSSEESTTLLDILKTRFEKNKNRHTGLEWSNVQTKLESRPEKMWSLLQMEKTGGEPDVVSFDEKTKEYIFFDSITTNHTCNFMSVWMHFWSLRKKGFEIIFLVDLFLQCLRVITR